MNIQTQIKTNHLSVDQHVDRIINSKGKLRESFFDYVNAINLAFEQLGQEIFDGVLAKRLGMAPSTLNRWKAIGNSNIITVNRDRLPTVFSSLYELTRLESVYSDFYGQREGPKKVQTLITRKLINQDSETRDIKLFIDEIKNNNLDTRRGEKENYIFELEGSEGYRNDFREQKLFGLVEVGIKVRTIVCVPPNDVLTRWSDSGVLSKDLNEEFPISELRGRSEKDPITILIILPNRHIDVGIKILRASGFSYRETFYPPYEGDGYNSTKNVNVVMYGQRGTSKSNQRSLSGGFGVDGYIDLAEMLGSEPRILLFERTMREGWNCLPDPI